MKKMITTVFILLILAFGMLLNASTSHIRWGSKDSPLDGLTITWRSSNTGDKIQWGYTTSFEQGEFTPTTYAGYIDNFNDYTFPAVTPNSTILYQIYDADAGSYGSTQTFDTAPVDGEPYTIIAMGDSRDNITDWQDIANAVNIHDAAAVLFSGDIVGDGSVNNDWDDWFDYGVNIIKDKLFYHTIGNHETYGGGVTKYLNNYVMPDAETGTELYYAFEYGNAIFINLNSEAPGDATQLTWLQNKLAANQDKYWKIVWFHCPFYTSGSHEGEMDSYFNTWWQAFDDYGVDLIFNGHDHMYERTLPINRNVSTTTPVAEYGSEAGQGRCQIVTGGAGAPLYSVNDRWWLDNGVTSLHYCKLDIDGLSITVNVYDETQSVIDQFVLAKTLPEGVYVKNLVSDKVYPFDTVDAFDVSNVFNDYEGDPVTVTIESNTDPSIATANLVGNTLTVTASGSNTGTAIITLKGEDVANGQSTTEEFQVLVFDPTQTSGDIEDFETGDFTKLSWTFAGNQDWQIITTDPYEGIYCANSEDIRKSQTSEMMVDYTFGMQGTVSFNYKTSSEAGYDFLTFYIDDNMQGQWSGILPWQYASFDVSTGTHTFKWVYSKDADTDDGTDDAFLDYIEFREGGSVIPEAGFSSDKNLIGVGEQVAFTDESTNFPTSWDWLFPGGIPSSSTDRNPVITYNTKGKYSVTLTATNNYGNDDEVKTGFINVDSGDTLIVTISIGIDDVEEKEGDGSIAEASTDIELMYDGAWNDQFHQHAGLRFQGVNIPNGAIIDSAYIQFTAKTADSNPVSFTIAGEDVDNSTPFALMTPYNVSNRIGTTAQISWNPTAWTTVGQAGEAERTSDIRSIVEEIVGRAGWNTGNAMTFIIWGDGSTQDVRRAYTYDNSPTTAPSLYVEYSLPESTLPQAPLNLVTSIVGSNLVIDWDVSANATSYDIYSSDDPYGTFDFVTNVGTNQYTIAADQAKLFYYIVAKNATKK